MYDNLPVDVRPEPGDVILVIDHEQSLGDPIPHIEGHLDQLKSRNYRHFWQLMEIVNCVRIKSIVRNENIR